MNTQVQLFNHNEFGNIRTMVEVSGEPLFCLSDVCKILGLRTNKVVQRLSKDVLSKYPLLTSGGNQVFFFVNEDGLYDVILDSRKPEAKAFRKWVTSEVLPSIRKTGAYMTQQTLMTVMQKPESILSICKKLVELNEENERLAPKAQYAEEVLLADGCITTTELGKELDMTRPQIFGMLHKMGVIFRGPSGKWMLYAEHHGKGYATYRTQTYDTLFGKGSRSTLVWTELGRKFVHSLFH